MPKGKKFNAAEKHFMEKELRLKREMNELRSFIQELYDINNKLETENTRLTTDNEQLHAWLECLLQYTDLSKEDIKRACKRDADIASFLETLFQLKDYLM